MRKGRRPKAECCFGESLEKALRKPLAIVILRVQMQKKTDDKVMVVWIAIPGSNQKRRML